MIHILDHHRGFVKLFIDYRIAFFNLRDYSIITQFLPFLPSKFYISNVSIFLFLYV